MTDRWLWDAPEPEDAEEPDPLDRPDLLPPADDADPWPVFDPFFGEEPPLCACCGAAWPFVPQDGDACPVCGWALDERAQADAGRESACNRGLTLEQAQMNFRAFGISDPALRWEE